jgi:cysteinyl-tRNA synthetase
MDDDLGTPAAVGTIHDAVRAGNKALAEGDRDTALRAAGEVRAMLGVLGLDPADPHWSQDRADDLTPVVDALVRGLLEQRATARAGKDFAVADAIRDQIKAAGIEIEDTPAGPKWSVG